MNKDGFDRFGRNKLFAPLLKWEAFKEDVVGVKTYAKQYEESYNTMQQAIQSKLSTDKILKKNTRASLRAG